MKPADTFSHWKRVRRGLLEVIENFEEEDLTYQTHPDGWPVGQIMIHIANAEEGWFRYAVQKEFDEWPSYLDFKNYPDKKSIIDALEDVHHKTELYLETLTEADLNDIIETPWGESIPLYWVFWHVLEHEIHHRGELSLILGMLGKEGLEV
jgi:uncharacterized damage-inducible protein DinB